VAFFIPLHLAKLTYQNISEALAPKERPEFMMTLKMLL